MWWTLFCQPVYFHHLVVVQDIVFQLQRLVQAMSKYHQDCYRELKQADVFPIEVDLTKGILGSALQ